MSKVRQGEIGHRSGRGFTEPGEYDYATPQPSPAVTAARAAFLDAIAVHAPQVLRDLRDCVLPAYFNALPEMQDGDSKLTSAWMHCNDETPNLMRLITELCTWAMNHRLHRQWILDSAYQTLHWHQGFLNCEEGPRPGQVRVIRDEVGWFPIVFSTEYRFLFLGQESKKDRRDVLWIRDGHIVPTPPLDNSPYGRAAGNAPDLFVNVNSKALLVHVEAAPWEPWFQTWAEFERRAKERFELTLSIYRERIQRIASEDEQLRKPERVRSWVMFDWLALWQCCGRTYTQIAEFEASRGKALEESAIGHGINKAARILGISDILREGSRGQPRKKRNFERRR
jgi:hypothetical protein